MCMSPSNSSVFWISLSPTLLSSTIYLTRQAYFPFHYSCPNGQRVGYLTAEGKRLGFEDMCALLGLPAREKFTGSAERVIDFLPAQKNGDSYDVNLGMRSIASVGSCC